MTRLAATSGPPAPAVPAAEQETAAAWASWYKAEAEPKLTGHHAMLDSVNPADEPIHLVHLDRLDEAVPGR